MKWGWNDFISYQKVLCSKWLQTKAMECPAKNPTATHKHVLQHLKISLCQLKSCKLFKNLPASESAILKDFFLIVLCCEREHATYVSVSSVFPTTKTSIFHLVICKYPKLATSLFLGEFLHQHMAVLRMIALAFSLLI